MRRPPRPLPLCNAVIPVPLRSWSKPFLFDLIATQRHCTKDPDNDETRFCFAFPLSRGARRPVCSRAAHRVSVGHPDCHGRFESRHRRTFSGRRPRAGGRPCHGNLRKGRHLGPMGRRVLQSPDGERAARCLLLRTSIRRPLRYGHGLPRRDHQVRRTHRVHRHCGLLAHRDRFRPDGLQHLRPCQQDAELFSART